MSNCDYCGTPFPPVSKRNRFCSRKCNNANSQKNRGPRKKSKQQKAQRALQTSPDPARRLKCRIASRRSSSNVSIANCTRVIAESNSRCRYCWKALNLLDFSSWEVDHIIPLSRGGAIDASNIAITCPKCNRAKSTMTYEEMVAWCRQIVEIHGAERRSK